MTYLGFPLTFKMRLKTNLIVSCEIIIMIENFFPLLIAKKFILMKLNRIFE